MAVDMFLKIDSVTGEAKDSVYEGDIEILAFSWGCSQSGSFHKGGGGGAGKANVQDLSITKWVDAASPTLIKYCTMGKHFPNGELVVRKAGGDEKGLEYMRIKFDKLMITSVSTGGSGGEDQLTENVTLNFAAFQVEYTPQASEGTDEACIPFGYNMAENIECSL